MIMKVLLTAMLMLGLKAANAQATTMPVEEHYPTSYWWWIVGVILAIGAGIALYMILKKDPRRDAID